MVRLTDHPNMTLDVYRGRKTKMQCNISFQNNPKDLDPSYKMDLDFLGLFSKGKIGIIAKFHRTD